MGLKTIFLLKPIIPATDNHKKTSRNSNAELLAISLFSVPAGWAARGHKAIATTTTKKKIVNSWLTKPVDWKQRTDTRNRADRNAKANEQASLHSWKLEILTRWWIMRRHGKHLGVQIQPIMYNWFIGRAKNNSDAQTGEILRFGFHWSRTSRGRSVKTFAVLSCKPPHRHVTDKVRMLFRSTQGVCFYARGDIEFVSFIHHGFMLFILISSHQVLI